DHEGSADLDRRHLERSERNGAGKVIRTRSRGRTRRCRERGGRRLHRAAQRRRAEVRQAVDMRNGQLARREFPIAMLVVALSTGLLAQSDAAQWVVWTRANSFPIASIVAATNDDFADLQFLK